MPDAVNIALSPDLDSPPCALCSGEDYELLMSDVKDGLYGKPGLFAVRRCMGCALVATRPRPTAERLGFYYRDVYSGASQARVHSWQTGWAGRWTAVYRLHLIRGRVCIDASTEVLDVGCGYGEFLRLCRERTGCRTFGLDMDENCATQARLHAGANCVAGDLMSHDWHEQRFELISFYHSLEHFADPVAALKAAHHLLKPSGYCAIEVPDFNGSWRFVFGSYWMPLVVPQHLFHFTPQSLQQCLERAGFSLVSRGSMWYPLESTVSLGMGLNALTRRIWPKGKFKWRSLRGVIVGLAAALWWPLIELPSQSILWLLGRTGTQWALARKVSPTSDVDAERHAGPSPTNAFSH